MKQFNEIRSISRDAMNLYKYGLLEIVPEKRQLLKNTNTKFSSPYKVSMSGLYYIILNPFDISFDDLIFSLFKNYKDNDMTLKYFLYPIISKETLLNVQWDTGFFSIVYSYLKEVCNLVVDLITLQNYSEPSETDDGHLLHQVFVWYHDRKTNYDHREDISRNIKNFLEVSLKWKGLKDVQINPIVEENLIRIVDRSKTDRNLRIHILKQDKKASLKWNGDIVYEFSVREEDDYLSIEAKDDSTYMDRLETIFWLSFRKIMLLFIATLKIQLTKHNPHFDSLNKDENFKKALDNLVKELKVK